MTTHCLLISGFGAPGFEWRFSPISNLLACHGWAVHQFRSGIGHPGERAEDLAPFVTGLDGDVFAVGHSMGGVVARALDALTGRLTAIVTLGSPHRGVSALSLLPGHVFGFQAIRENSPFMRRLEAAEQTADYACVAGARDPLVSRDSAWGIAGADQFLVPSGHTELFVRRDVAGIVGDFFDVNNYEEAVA